MYCNNCGQNLPPGSKFCNFCGANLSLPGATYQPVEASRSLPTTAVANDEQVVLVVRPTMIFVVARYVIAALLFLTLLIVSLALQKYLGEKYSGVAPLIAFVLGLIVFLNPIYHHLRRQREVYTLTNHKIEFTYGLLGKTTRNIPLAKIQDVTATATAVERLLGVGDIIIDSAAMTGKIPLRKVNNPKALTDIILKEMRDQSRK